MTEHPSQPPAASRRATLDNAVLVPASQLPFKEHWQKLANTLPSGTTLIILPHADTPQRRALEAAAARLRAKRQPVTIKELEPEDDELTQLSLF